MVEVMASVKATRTRLVGGLRDGEWHRQRGNEMPWELCLPRPQGNPYIPVERYETYELTALPTERRDATQWVYLYRPEASQ